MCVWTIAIIISFGRWELSGWLQRCLGTATAWASLKPYHALTDHMTSVVKFDLLTFTLTSSCKNMQMKTSKVKFCCMIGQQWVWYHYASACPVEATQKVYRNTLFWSTKWEINGLNHYPYLVAGQDHPKPCSQDLYRHWYQAPEK